MVTLPALEITVQKPFAFGGVWVYPQHISWFEFKRYASNNQHDLTLHMDDGGYIGSNNPFEIDTFKKVAGLEDA